MLTAGGGSDNAQGKTGVYPRFQFLLWAIIIETRPGVISPELLEVHMCNYIDYISVANTIVVVIDHDKPAPLMTPLDRVHPGGDWVTSYYLYCLT